MPSGKLQTLLGAPIQDAEEETFLLFSQDFPSNNLGFIDSKAETLEIDIRGQDYFLRQSPGLLTSNRSGGTTGAVLWKITPLLAAWLSSLPSFLSDIGALGTNAIVAELGCGVSGLVGLVLSRIVKCYILTDQHYVMKYLKENISANTASHKSDAKASKKRGNPPKHRSEGILKPIPLDWETDDVEILRAALTPDVSVDLLLLCDCVYNDFLIPPLVQTCVDICHLGSSCGKTTVVLIAQQLRSDSICESFFGTLLKWFDVWRVPDDKVSAELRLGSGYAVHLAVLKEQNSNAETRK
ncbi:hypothetical protein A1O3_10425 [Capronia epimyces CBS 606.96]|uniref:Diaminohydroxyphosphoribosylamino-pyrimidine deaminase n=1 Tax=Capronia epimyces CBS 606.96 TaxID=1182542 RepID=W9X9X6_9EURO|nr:uncharacterized protein A1O3_10425 [Capronia epimyces CBS 606.96]EXJ77267.1 hypothetical protein A1O3_10425 [Capronia epimyces CBS 606.96]